ncbi:MAG: flagellar biosynthesis anti-sigma factor FlgM [Candidatus Marinimicrobia bacterium]|nr:flagellar biosynthesis anti-sigma factor FlgM [Candidatus Neomarinimicrobiota bacterium]MCF7841110.1 flagellar biosynthesis anti-sigma factor FlgM [Candidatus Neomarinimicrobiota bacterium]MCF7901800.1 flagellar biosynthesis anti-sigma factor FlgM [Candidatus Neomarinimicrobiota bacterium]
MGPIKDINNLPPEFRRLRENQATNNRTGNQSKVGKQETTNSDPPESGNAARVKISNTGRNLLQQMEEVGRYLQVLKESDSAEIARINKAITSGKYDTPESHEKIAEGIMGDPGIREILTARFEELQKQRENPHQLSDEEIQSIREKIQQGYYEQPRVIEDIAGRILRPGD